MIERLTIQNFKSLRQVELNLGRLNFFIGPNASGKSNLLDALQYLSNWAEGKSAIKALEVIRGGFKNAFFKSAEAEAASQIRVDVLVSNLGSRSNYTWTVNQEGKLCDERLTINDSKAFIFDGHEGSFWRNDGQRLSSFPGGHNGSELKHGVVFGMAQSLQTFVEAILLDFSTIQPLVLDPRVLRGYGPTIPVNRMAEDGEGFASIVQAICQDARTKQAYLSWLQEMRPAEVDDVGIKPGAQGEPMFCVIENGEARLAPVLSEGTLRFAAVAAAFFQPELPPLLALEEVDNGIHPSRLRLLVELLRSQAALGKTQILATTHSPLVLAWLKPEEYQHVFCFKRDTATGETIVKPLCELPGFTEIIQQQSVMDLLIEGWMESVL